MFLIKREKFFLATLKKERIYFIAFLIISKQNKIITPIYQKILHFQKAQVI